MNGDAGMAARRFEGVEEVGDFDGGGGAAQERAFVAGGEGGQEGCDVDGGEGFHDGVAGREGGPLGVGGSGLFVGAGNGLGGIEEFDASKAAEGDGVIGEGGEFMEEGFEMPEALALEDLVWEIGEGGGGPEGAEGGAGSALTLAAGIVE